MEESAELRSSLLLTEGPTTSGIISADYSAEVLHLFDLKNLDAEKLFGDSNATTLVRRRIVRTPTIGIDRSGRITSSEVLMVQYEEKNCASVPRDQLKLNFIGGCDSERRGSAPAVPSLQLRVLEREYFEPVRDRDKNWAVQSYRRILNEVDTSSPRLKLGYYPPLAMPALQWSSSLQGIHRRVRLLRVATSVSDTPCVVDIYGIGIAGRVLTEGQATNKVIIVDVYSVWNARHYGLVLSKNRLRELFASQAGLLKPGHKSLVLRSIVKRLYFTYNITYKGFDELRKVKHGVAIHLDAPLFLAEDGNLRSIGDVIGNMSTAHPVTDCVISMEQDIHIAPDEKINGTEMRRLAYINRDKTSSKRKIGHIPKRKSNGYVASYARRSAGYLVVSTMYLPSERPNAVVIHAYFNRTSTQMKLNMSISNVGRMFKVSLNPTKWSTKVRFRYSLNALRQFRLQKCGVSGNSSIKLVVGTTQGMPQDLERLYYWVLDESNMYELRRRRRSTCVDLRIKGDHTFESYEPPHKGNFEYHNDGDIWCDFLYIHIDRIRLVLMERNGSLNHRELFALLTSLASSSQEKSKYEAANEENRVKVLESVVEIPTEKSASFDTFPAALPTVWPILSSVCDEDSLKHRRAACSWHAMSHATVPVPFSDWRRTCRPRRSVGLGYRQLRCGTARITNIHCFYSLFLVSPLRVGRDFQAMTAELQAILSLAKYKTKGGEQSIRSKEATDGSSMGEDMQQYDNTAAKDDDHINNDTQNRNDSVVDGQSDDESDEDDDDDGESSSLSASKFIFGDGVAPDELEMKNAFFDKYGGTLEVELEIYVPYASRLHGKYFIPAGTIHRIRFQKEDLCRLVPDISTLLSAIRIGEQSFHAHASDEDVAEVRKNWEIIAASLTSQAEWDNISYGDVSFTTSNNDRENIIDGKSGGGAVFIDKLCHVARLLRMQSVADPVIPSLSSAYDFLGDDYTLGFKPRIETHAHYHDNSMVTKPCIFWSTVVFRKRLAVASMSPKVTMPRKLDVFVWQCGQKMGVVAYDYDAYNMKREVYLASPSTRGQKAQIFGFRLMSRVERALVIGMFLASDLKYFEMDSKYGFSVEPQSSSHVSGEGLGGMKTIDALSNVECSVGERSLTYGIKFPTSEADDAEDEAEEVALALALTSKDEMRDFISGALDDVDYSIDFSPFT